MTLVHTDWCDGSYYYQEAACEQTGTHCCAEVPNEVVELWRAVGQLSDVIQNQLRDLDNHLREPTEEPRGVARRGVASVSVDRSDGRFTCRQTESPAEGNRTVQVPEALLQMWDAIRSVDASAQEQIAALYKRLLRHEEPSE